MLYKMQTLNLIGRQSDKIEEISGMNEILVRVQALKMKQIAY